MDSNFWGARLSSASKRYQSALQSRSGLKWDGFDAELMGFEEIEMEDDVREEYPCIFCSEYFDIVGLCCHIDEEHPVEAKKGVCPVCAMRVGAEMVAHITSQHGSICKSQRKRKASKANSHSPVSLLRRELGEGNFQSLFRNSSRIVSSSNAAPDPFLSSFILPMAEDYGSTSLLKEKTTYIVSERKVQHPPMSIKDQEERTERCNFVQDLLVSTILDNDL